MTETGAIPTIPKVLTRIEGFDNMLRGGLPQGRATVVVGATGSGKTMLGLQFLADGVHSDGETGIFVSFEESRADVLACLGALGWPAQAPDAELHIMDADFLPNVVQSGAFDLNGLLAALSALIRESGAKRIVFDAVDVLLDLLDDPAGQRRELHRLFHWVSTEGITAILTAKADGFDLGNPMPRQPLLVYLSHCVVILRYNLQDGICGRSVRLLKYRGTNHSLNEYPMMIGARGIAVYGIRSSDMSYPVSTRRVSSGVERLDTMLGGGYYEGSSILISGSPGTAKTTFGGAFIEAACARGDNALLISFDEAPEQIIRNLASVGIDLASHAAAGRLRIHGYRAAAIETEAFLMKVLAELDEHNIRALVLDPVSALANRTQFRGKNEAAARLLDEAKARGITVVVTSLLDKATHEAETTQAAVSTIADTWMELTFRAAGGERNRAITIIKSRGMSHSNQVREVSLSHEGVTLSDVYFSGGDVLMGTARIERELAEQASESARREEFERRRVELELTEQRLSMQRMELEAEIAARRSELKSLQDSEDRRLGRKQKSLDAVLNNRRADDGVRDGD
ncbi:circadian clock protein KaiC [Iodidimonas sp. SYSU 1G8]|uniref:circadian clock protein KaiC n=1 Tax=Iodidimonas sp. SYSU 1G8 TaxID=3133967 RepID=UPI0031FE4FE2